MLQSKLTHKNLYFLCLILIYPLFIDKCISANKYTCVLQYASLISATYFPILDTYEVDLIMIWNF